MSRRFAWLLALPLAACADGTELLGGGPEAPEMTQTDPTSRGLLVRDAMGTIVGHLVLDDATSGVFLYQGDIHRVQVSQTDGGLEVTGFERVDHEGVLTVEIDRMRVQWAGEVGVGVGTISGASTFCDIDYCLPSERFSREVATSPVDGVAAVEVSLENGFVPTRFFPNDALRIAFDRFFDVAHVRDHLEVAVDGARIPGELRVTESAGPHVAAVVFEPAAPFPSLHEISITLPGAVASLRRTTDPVGSIVVDGRLDMNGWAVPDGDGFSYEFACVRPERGPLLVLRSDVSGMERAYTYVEAGAVEYIELDVLSASSWTSNPSMARILVDGVAYYQHGGPSVFDRYECSASAGPGDYYEVLSGGDAVRIPIEGEPGQRVHITVEAWSEGVSPRSAIVVGMFAGR